MFVVLAVVPVMYALWVLVTTVVVSVGVCVLLLLWLVGLVYGVVVVDSKQQQHQ